MAEQSAAYWKGRAEAAWEREDALSLRVLALREALTEAVAELVECRSFISVETRHYPTVTGINTEVEELRKVLNGQLTRSGVTAGGESNG